MSIACPVCGAKARVVATRTRKGANTVTRRYECVAPGVDGKPPHRFTTGEAVRWVSESAHPSPVATDGGYPSWLFPKGGAK